MAAPIRPDPNRASIHRCGVAFTLTLLMVCLAIYLFARHSELAISELYGLLDCPDATLIAVLVLSPVAIVIAIGSYLLCSRAVFVRTLLLTLFVANGVPYPLTRRMGVDVESMVPRMFFVSLVCVTVCFAVAIAMRQRFSAERFQYSTSHLLLLVTVACLVLALWKATGG